MTSLDFVLSVAQIASGSLIAWPIYRIARRVGYRKVQAWAFVACSIALSVAGLVLYAVAADHGWLFNAATPLQLLGTAATNFAFTSSTLVIVPTLYLSFKKWPLELQRRETEIFG